MSKLYIAANMPEHDQLDIHAGEPVFENLGEHRLGLGTIYPCAVPGVSLTDYSTNPQGKGWGPKCTGPFATITLSNGVRITCDARIGELAKLILNKAIANGYNVRQADTGCYNCRNIAGTNIPSNHSWGLAFDVDWNTNPQHSPLISDQPTWLLQMWNRYGFAWGGNYNPPTVPDAMHHEFMATPAQCVVATNLARAELGGAAPAPAAVYPPKFTWALPAGDYYGNINGPAASHGGYNASEQAAVKGIQQWLVWWGCAAGVPGYAWQTTSWADGKWESATDQAMSLWHQLHYPGQQYTDRCYSDDYAKLVAG